MEKKYLIIYYNNDKISGVKISIIDAILDIDEKIEKYNNHEDSLKENNTAKVIKDDEIIKAFDSYSRDCDMRYGISTLIEQVEDLSRNLSNVEISVDNFLDFQKKNKDDD